MAALSHGAPGGGRPAADAAGLTTRRRARLSARRLLRLLLLAALALLARPFVRRPAGLPHKILYVKPDHLGDLLLATPALAALRRRFPDAQISALVGPWARAALGRNPDIDRLLTYPFPGFARAGDQASTKDEGRRTKDEGPATNDQRSSVLGSRFSVLGSRFSVLNSARPWWELLRYGLLLRTGGYDLAIIGRDDHWWGAALALLAGVPRRVGFAVPECRPFLSAALPWRSGDHVTLQGLALVEAAWTAKDEGRRTEDSASRSAGAWPARFDPERRDLAWADGWLAEHLAGDGKLVIIHPGTGGPAKLWLADRWAALADALAARGDVRLLLTGGPGEEALVEAVQAGMRAQTQSLAGRTSLGQLAALLRRADLVLGVDSGPLHLAAAQGTPTIHLYGPGDERRFGPWGDPSRQVVLRTALWCSPCGVFGSCPRGLALPECMERISTATVLEAAQAALGA